ncbi:MAG: hypothetical protein Greene041662_753 [Candidatus Peregrinibacteria bacterium Greene0416_62]|nr:MAG: hypothetical protein Greene041662_753 [Candidatus Peregrinibacteria bacterium Greene0416_62]TSD00676.1 MAG: hypothetical protein Greene101449_50 [Candidatus Peregrinibacteria bacterium Greene1014_49]
MAYIDFKILITKMSISMGILDELKNFGSLVYTVGDGCPPNADGLNALSRANAERAAQVANLHPDSILFIAGGNGGQTSRRGYKIEGYLTEAERMASYIKREFHGHIPIITDCDPGFLNRFEEVQPPILPSTNTIENSRNAAHLISANDNFRSCDIVAERMHLPRVIGTFRREMQRICHDRHLQLHSHPVDAAFEMDNDQWHLQSRLQFQLWNALSCMHHLLMGAVPRAEFVKEMVTGNRYRNLEDRR